MCANINHANVYVFSDAESVIMSKPSKPRSTRGTMSSPGPPRGPDDVEGRSEGSFFESGKPDWSVLASEQVCRHVNKEHSVKQMELHRHQMLIDQQLIDFEHGYDECLNFEFGNDERRPTIGKMGMFLWLVLLSIVVYDCQKLQDMYRYQ
jgi:hypothetical protein